MKLFKVSQAIEDYGPFVGALVPTLIVLLAAGISLTDRSAVEGVTLPVMPIYRTS
jgi:hypothetical protein